jgi:hypothetical protein
VCLKPPWAERTLDGKHQSHWLGSLLNEEFKRRKKSGINTNSQNEAGVKKKTEDLVVEFQVHEIADNHHKFDSHHD